jgi:alkylation response protein AidB-like acyl-CoA dehydrogenase
MTATAVDVPSKEDLLERVEALKPLLVRNAAEAEESRRIPEESIAALTDAGLFRVVVPRRFVAMRCRSTPSSRCRPSWGRRAARRPGW